ncbi:DoxX family protein [Nocardia mexicana]|uniref:Putative membrane protein n=1 Tax=Nocardia mexicana TaxID=279262 RepID=A0A370H0Y3_9NOCA|nr:DoxX family protein [Nocardia mexicana]RDI49643.1 putative membrane protein [Nocardia mexicana]
MFETLMLMVVPALVFRLLGVFGVRRFATWRVAFAHGLAVLLVFTGSAHFVPDSVEMMPSHDDLVAMVPPALPFPGFLIYLTGVLELLGALGLVVARTRVAAGLGLAVLFVVMVPANIYAAVEDIPLNGDPATPLWFRLPEQVVYIAVALWSSAAGAVLMRYVRAGATRSTATAASLRQA